jgi:hypothetical protein
MYIAEVQVKGQEDPVFTLTKPVPDSHLMCHAAAQPLVPYSAALCPCVQRELPCAPDEEK